MIQLLIETKEGLLGPLGEHLDIHQASVIESDYVNQVDKKGPRNVGRKKSV